MTQYPRAFTPSDVSALKVGEHTCEDERWAHTLRRRAIDAGRSVSPIAYDGSRGVYAWDVLN